MRTTLSLDDDVAALLTRVRKLRKAGLKQVINEALRHGLRAMTAKAPKPSTPYETHSADLGKCLVGSLDDVSEALSLGEGEDFK